MALSDLAYSRDEEKIVHTLYVPGQLKVEYDSNLDTLTIHRNPNSLEDMTIELMEANQLGLYLGRTNINFPGEKINKILEALRFMQICQFPKKGEDAGPALTNHFLVLRDFIKKVAAELEPLYQDD